MSTLKENIITWLLKLLDAPLPRLEILCRECGKWHPVHYGTNAKTGKETDLVMGFTCGKTDYLCGVAGKAIDGNKFRKASNNDDRLIEKAEKIYKNLLPENQKKADEFLDRLVEEEKKHA
jgi:hypothetical protein